MNDLIFMHYADVALLVHCTIIVFMMHPTYAVATRTRSILYTIHHPLMSYASAAI
jgi:hypothetical protein